MEKIKPFGTGGYTSEDPDVTLCLAVLKEAKKGYTAMWRDFVSEHDMSKRNWDSFQVALWVQDWWQQDLQGKIIYDWREPREAPDGTPHLTK